MSKKITSVENQIEYKGIHTAGIVVRCNDLESVYLLLGS